MLFLSDSQVEYLVTPLFTVLSIRERSERFTADIAAFGRSSAGFFPTRFLRGGVRRTPPWKKVGQ